MDSYINKLMASIAMSCIIIFGWLIGKFIKFKLNKSSTHETYTERKERERREQEEQDKRK